MSETVLDRSRNNMRHAELPMSSKNNELKKPIRTDLSKKRWPRQKLKAKSESQIKTKIRIKDWENNSTHEQQKVGFPLRVNKRTTDPRRS
jgi:hypothetical protein